MLIQTAEDETDPKELLNFNDIDWNTSMGKEVLAFDRTGSKDKHTLVSMPSPGHRGAVYDSLSFKGLKSKRRRPRDPMDVDEDAVPSDQDSDSSSEEHAPEKKASYGRRPRDPKFDLVFNPGDPKSHTFVQFQQEVMTYASANRLQVGAKHPMQRSRFTYFSRKVYQENISQSVKTMIGYDEKLVAKVANNVFELLQVLRQRYTRVDEYAQEWEGFQKIKMRAGEVHPGRFLLESVAGWNRLQLVRKGVLAAYPGQKPLLMLPSPHAMYRHLRNKARSQACWDAMIRLVVITPMTHQELLDSLKRLEHHLDSNASRRKDRPEAPRQLAPMHAATPKTAAVRPKQPGQRSWASDKRRGGRRGPCYYCEKTGHIRRFCQNQINDRAQGWCTKPTCGRRQHKFKACPRQPYRGASTYSGRWGKGPKPSHPTVGPSHDMHPERVAAWSSRPISGSTAAAGLKIAALGAVSDSGPVKKEGVEDNPWSRLGTLLPMVAVEVPKLLVTAHADGAGRQVEPNVVVTVADPGEGRQVTVPELGLLHTTVSLAHKPVTLMLNTMDHGDLEVVADTGANISAATRAWAAKVGLKVKRRTTVLSVDTANGRTTTRDYVTMQLVTREPTLRPVVATFFLFDDLPYEALVGRHLIHALGYGLVRATAKGETFHPTGANTQLTSEVHPGHSWEGPFHDNEEKGADDVPAGYSAFHCKGQRRDGYAHPDEYLDPSLLLPAEPVTDVSELRATVTPLNCSSPRPPGQTDEGGALSPAGRQELQHLVAEYNDVWAQHQFDVGRFDDYPFRIELKEAERDKPPHNIHKSYRVKPELMATCKRQLEDMVKGGIIRRAPGEWGSGILFVQKKGGEQRLCVDYRELNRRTKKDDYPTPRIDDTVSRLAKHKFFSSFDLRGGYMHVPFHPDSMPLTRFITPFGATRPAECSSGL